MKRPGRRPSVLGMNQLVAPITEGRAEGACRLGTDLKGGPARAKARQEQAQGGQEEGSSGAIGGGLGGRHWTSISAPTRREEPEIVIRESAEC